MRKRFVRLRKRFHTFDAVQPPTLLSLFILTWLSALRGVKSILQKDKSLCLFRNPNILFFKICLAESCNLVQFIAMTYSINVGLHMLWILGQKWITIFGISKTLDSILGVPKTLILIFRGQQRECGLDPIGSYWKLGSIPLGLCN